MKSVIMIISGFAGLTAAQWSFADDVSQPKSNHDEARAAIVAPNHSHACWPDPSSTNRPVNGQLIDGQRELFPGGLQIHEDVRRRQARKPTLKEASSP
jgi:hypothetical protein